MHKKTGKETKEQEPKETIAKGIAEALAKSGEISSWIFGKFYIFLAEPRFKLKTVTSHYLKGPLKPGCPTMTQREDVVP